MNNPSRNYSCEKNKSGSNYKSMEIAKILKSLAIRLSESFFNKENVN